MSRWSQRRGAMVPDDFGIWLSLDDVQEYVNALRKYGCTQTASGKQCRSCGYFGMLAHREDCEIGRLIGSSAQRRGDE